MNIIENVALISNCIVNMINFLENKLLGEENKDEMFWYMTNLLQRMIIIVLLHKKRKHGTCMAVW